MSYEDLKLQADRQPVTIVEVEFDNEAAVFSKDFQPLGYNALACLKNVTEAPTQLATAEGLKFDSEINFVCQDFEEEVGTYFGKLLARNPYWLDRKVTLKVGYLVNGVLVPENTNHRTYFLSEVTGPDGNGVIKFKAKGMMSRISNDRDQAPKGSSASLQSPLNNSFAGVLDVGTTQVDTDFILPPSGFVIIDEEILQYDSRTATTINILSRGALNTIPADHDSGESVGGVYYFNGNPVDAITDLLSNYVSNTAITDSIDVAMFDQQKDIYLIGVTIEAIIVEPTSVKEIIDQISHQAYLSVWWDEQALNTNVIPNNYGMIKLLAVNGYDFDTIQEIDEKTQILKGKYTLKHSVQKMVTEAWIYYNKKDPTKGDSADNYANLSIFLNPESAQNWGTLGQPLVKPQIVYASMIDSGAIASRLGQLIISRNKEGLRVMTFTLDASDSNFWTGNSVTIDTSLLQTVDGEPKNVICEITKSKQLNAGQYEYTALVPFVEFTPNYGLITPDTQPDWTSATEAQKLKYMFISDDNGLMSDGSPAPTIRA